ncbi:MAG: YraN family protein [Chloroflexi bacterium]|nr:YraN family protein [Chloroflexota bacterium]
MGSSSGSLNLPKGVGRAGEAAARSYVVAELGYEVLKTNYRTRTGEIDIVAQDGDWVVFVEVKTRTSRVFGSTVEQIAAQKKTRLRAAAQSFLTENDLENADWRIDLLSVDMDRAGRVRQIEHIRSAIEE